jgi:hypothetical protein
MVSFEIFSSKVKKVEKGRALHFSLGPIFLVTHITSYFLMDMLIDIYIGMQSINIVT